MADQRKRSTQNTMLKSRFNLAKKMGEEVQPDEDEDADDVVQVDQASSKSSGRGRGRGRGKSQSRHDRPAPAVVEQEEPKAPVEEHSAYGEYLGEGEGDAELEEPRVVYDYRRLKRAEVGIRLSLLGKTADGEGYTYLKAACTGMGLTDISAIKCFQHLQFLDVSNNNLELPALQAVTHLPYLVLIHADRNALKSAALNKMKYLQVIIMNNNQISSVQDVFQPELTTLEVGYNNIKRMFFINKMPTIKCLDFKYNLIKDISDLDYYPNLDSLYLAGNKIKSLEGLERLVKLRLLHLRYNPIKLLNGFDAGLKKLQYINLRNCKVATLKQIKKLRVLPALETLVIKGCPYMGGTGEEEGGAGQAEDDPELRVEVLASLPALKRLNKGIVTPEEKQEAKELMAQWLEEGEKSEEEIEDEEHENVVE